MIKLKKNVFDVEIEKKIMEIDSTMKLEGMPLTKSLKDNLRKCFYGQTTPEAETEKLKEKYERK